MDSAKLGLMLDQVVDWPADRVNVWNDASVGLGTRQFFVTQEDTWETLPLQLAGRYVLTSDARIDNRQELISKLNLNAESQSSITDSLLILWAYQKWGEECPNFLIGDFAFAIWDFTERRLFCARDGMGIRPFYYCHIPGKLFAFGSTVEMVRSVCNGVDTGINELKLGLMMALDYHDTTMTIRKNILRLPGGHCISLRDNRVVERSYWNLENVSDIRLSSDREYAEALREIFYESVRCRLRSTHPIGSQLSGGLDSSSVTCTASRILNSESFDSQGQLHTFSAVFPETSVIDKNIDERHYQQDVVKQYSNIVHHPINCDGLDPLHDALWRNDQPVLGYNLYLENAMFVKAKEVGVVVLLTGYDGDTTISHGFERFTELVRTFHWVSLVRECIALSRTYKGHFLKKIWHLGFAPYFNQYKQIQSLKRMNHDDWKQANPLLDDAFMHHHNMAAVLRSNFINELKSLDLGRSKAENILAITSGIWADFAEIYDCVSRRMRLEARHPFFDRRLIEFSLAIPCEQKMKGGVSRYIMHNAMEGIIPDSVNRRGKALLGAAFRRGLSANLKKWVSDFCKTENKIFRYIDKAYLDGIIPKVKDYQMGGVTDKEMMDLFCAMVFSKWLELQS